MDEPLEDRDSWSTANCSIARTVDLLGSRSVLLVLREAFLGTRRFDDFSRRVGLGEPATAARLRELTEAGVFERVPYREPGQRTRYEYRLTEKGRDLLPVITALRQWGDRWTADEVGPSVLAHHRGCGAPVRTELRCQRGHEVDPTDFVTTAGPGLLRTTG